MAGRTYRIRYAVQGNGGQARVRVRLGDVNGGDSTLPAGPWQWAEHTVTAAADQAVLTLEPLTAVNLDAVSVVWLNEPPKLVLLPQAGFAYVGGSASFVAGATGAEPLTFEWYHDGERLPDMSGPVLNLEPVALTQAGNYQVVARNPFGTASSPPVALTVQVAASPQIVLQPQGEAVVPGQFAVLTVVAVGPPPLRYQWFHRGQPLPNGTNRSLVFPAVTPADLGHYHVVVSSHTETTESLPAELSLAPETESGPGWEFNFTAFHPDPSAQVDAFVFDTDGSTRLKGAHFRAQLYAGPSVEALRPRGLPQPFLDGFNDGRWQFARVDLPFLRAGGQLVTQVRAWDASVAASYEEARALGHRFGRSKILNWTTSDPPAPRDLVPVGLESFALQLGLPDFTVGRIEAELEPDGKQVTFRLTGAWGFRYLLEQRLAGGHWKPVKIFENLPGQASFTHPLTEPESALFRARILN